jgi:hypothetical protein
MVVAERTPVIFCSTKNRVGSQQLLPSFQYRMPANSTASGHELIGSILRRNSRFRAEGQEHSQLISERVLVSSSLPLELQEFYPVKTLRFLW